MQRARRLAPIAAVAAIAALALSGCRSEPGVAAYVGDKQITENQVTEIVDDAAQASGAQQRTQPPSRGQVVRILVLGDVCERLSADKGYQPHSLVSAQQVAQAFGISPEAAYARKVAQLYTCLSGVPTDAAQAPTEEEMGDLVPRAKAAGVIPADMTVQEATAKLDGAQLRGALATRRVLAQAATGYDITVNPRYRPLEFPLLSFPNSTAAVSVPLGEGDAGVVVVAR